VSFFGIMKGEILLTQKWYEPRRSLWDRIALEDPLDPPPPEGPKPIPYVVTNNTATTITIDSLSTASTPTTVPIYLGTYDGRMARAVPAGTMLNYGYGGRGTGASYDNYPSTPVGQVIAPWPRNRHEERVFRSIEKNQRAVLQRAEKALGSRREAKSQEEWNDRFWELLSHPTPKAHQPWAGKRRFSG
jgi:hypothetical protein